MRVGILTGGGDCPGLNAVIRGVVRTGIRRYDHEHVGIRHGWRGLFERDVIPLDQDRVSGILPLGGTMLRSSRTNPYSRDGGPEEVLAAAKDLGIDALVAIGGEDTLGVADKLYKDYAFPVVGVPKTIDNDLSGTDVTFGFWTAVQIAVDAIDRLHTTADSHDRIIVVEVMGRHAGWIALESGIAGGAHVILLPERPTTVDRVAELLNQRLERGKEFAIVVVSEGVQFEGTSSSADDLDEFGHVKLADAGVATFLADRLKTMTGKDCRAVVLGHIQRGGSPLAFDRSLATRFGVHAAEMVAGGLFGRMAAVRGADILDVPLAEAVGTLKTVPPERFEEKNPFIG
ncbi:MAG: 6-phosphofructokinase [Actinobacteria bacterium]|nr:6-phosphofructokinase [Actinomycetota bacterium]